MKLKTFVCLAAATILAFAAASAQEAPAPHPVIAEKDALFTRVWEKMRTPGENTEEKFAPELAQFDALLKKYAGDRSEAVASLALTRAEVYQQVLQDEEGTRKALEEVVAGFPGTKHAALASERLHSLTPEAKAHRARIVAERQARIDAAIGKPAPALDFIWSSEGQFRTLSELKGKVVVLDFWATWCGPCIATFPKVREEVAHFKGLPVMFLGVTSLQGRVHNLKPAPIDTKDDPQKEFALTRDFMQAREMTWPVAFTRQEVLNPDYFVFGVPMAAIVAPDGTLRYVGLPPGNPKSGIVEKVTAMLKEFNLPAPGG